MEIQEVVMDDTCKNNVLIVDNMRNDRYLNFTGTYRSSFSMNLSLSILKTLFMQNFQNIALRQWSR